MPFFEKTSGAVTINGSPMTDVQGDMHHNDYSKRIVNNGSYSTTTHTMTNSNNPVNSNNTTNSNNTINSNNNSSRVGSGNGNTYNTHTDSRNRPDIHEKAAPTWDTRPFYSHQARPDITPAERGPSRNFGGRGPYDNGYPTREGYSPRFPEASQYSASNPNPQRQDFTGREPYYGHQYPIHERGPSRFSEEGQYPGFSSDSHRQDFIGGREPGYERQHPVRERGPWRFPEAGQYSASNANPQPQDFRGQGSYENRHPDHERGPSIFSEGRQYPITNPNLQDQRQGDSEPQRLQQPNQNDEEFHQSSMHTGTQYQAHVIPDHPTQAGYASERSRQQEHIPPPPPYSPGPPASRNPFRQLAQQSQLSSPFPTATPLQQPPSGGLGPLHHQ